MRSHARLPYFPRLPRFYLQVRLSASLIIRDLYGSCSQSWDSAEDLSLALVLAILSIEASSYAHPILCSIPPPDPAPIDF